MRGAWEKGNAVGEVRGEARGEARGAHKRAVEIAVNFKKAGIAIDIIAENTGLSPEEVARL
jgi:predicted transposase YdaD